MDELPVAFSNWTLGTSPKGNQRYFRIWSFVRISTIAILPSSHHCFHCFFVTTMMIINAIVILIATIINIIITIHFYINVIVNIV